jgi:hypothetical protein
MSYVRLTSIRFILHAYSIWIPTQDFHFLAQQLNNSEQNTNVTIQCLVLWALLHTQAVLKHCSMGWTESPVTIIAAYFLTSSSTALEIRKRLHSLVLEQTYCIKL